jgi:hypothetical protein
VNSAFFYDFEVNDRGKVDACVMGGCHIIFGTKDHPAQLIDKKDHM